jgi:hypothetical protein
MFISIFNTNKVFLHFSLYYYNGTGLSRIIQYRYNSIKKNVKKTLFVLNIEINIWNSRL